MDRHVLIVTDPPRGDHRPPGVTARATASLVETVLKHVKIRRVAVAGGDTSSFAARSLGLWGLTYETSLSPGVPLCRGHSDQHDLDGIELVLKGGQMGRPDLFETLIKGS